MLYRTKVALVQEMHRDKYLYQGRGKEAHREITLITIPFQLPCPGPNQFVVVVDNNVAINVQQVEKLVLYAKSQIISQNYYYLLNNDVRCQIRRFVFLRIFKSILRV